MGKKLIKSFGELELSTAINHKYIYIYICQGKNTSNTRTSFSFLCAMHCSLQNRTTNFKTINQISNRYGALLFPKNALRKGEK